MRIRWTTRIATAAGLLTLIAGIATGGGGAAHAAPRAAAAAVVATTTASVSTGLSWTHRGS
jgi:hypothetical protein